MIRSFQAFYSTPAFSAPTASTLFVSLPPSSDSHPLPPVSPVFPPSPVFRFSPSSSTQPSLLSLEPFSLPAKSPIPIRMFNRLPPELVRQIIESAIPPTSLSSNYAERQNRLQAFCFVCRYLRHVAQPLLFASVSAKNSPRTLNDALITVQSKAEHSKEWTRYIRQVSIERSGSLSPIKSRFKRLARNGQGLRVLTLAYLEETVNLALLTQLPRQSFSDLPVSS